ncbi:MAG: DUF4824 family protein [Acidobacteria bacterium]|nr:DUF4824 family protein [Acidobacteriota bacterium]
MRRPRVPASVVAGCAVVLLANLWILALGAWNRWGGREVRIELTERELTLPHFSRADDSAIFLTLRTADEAPPAVMRAAGFKGRWPRPATWPWLDRAKLAELGFATEVDPAAAEAEEHYWRMSPRTAFIALEYDGPAWTEWLRVREKRLRSGAAEIRESNSPADAEALLALDRATRSRLVPVDAARDPGALAARCAEGRCIVLQGLVRPVVVTDDGTARLGGQLVELAIRQLRVPPGVRARLLPYVSRESEDDVATREREAAQSGWPEPLAPRYEVSIAVGARLEPWVVDARARTATGEADQ